MFVIASRDQGQPVKQAPAFAPRQAVFVIA
jgi:hypothetical protein